MGEKQLTMNPFTHELKKKYPGGAFNVTVNFKRNFELLFTV